jgi:hypothetical protein
MNLSVAVIDMGHFEVKRLPTENKKKPEKKKQKLLDAARSRSCDCRTMNSLCLRLTFVVLTSSA